VECWKAINGRAIVRVTPTVLRALALVLLALLALLSTACSATRTKERPAGSPTTTLTPSGDVLRIDGAVVRRVLIPDPSQDPLYALTDETLYARGTGVWEPTKAGSDQRTLLIDPVDPERLFRGAHAVCQLDDTDPSEPFELEVSHDGGNSWRQLGQGKNIEPLAFDLVDPEVLYGSDCNLAISYTSGNTWLHFDPIPDYALTELQVVEERLLLLGTTLAGGSELVEVDIADPRKPEIGDVLLDIPGSASFDARGGRIVVGAADTMHLSVDGGLTWATSKVGLENVTAPVASPQSVRPDGATPSDDVGILTVKIGLTEGRLYAGTPHGLFISQDDGTTWVRYDEISPEARVTEIQFGLDGADLYITTDKGVVVVPAP
jgi:hypothetical protein